MAETATSARNNAPHKCQRNDSSLEAGAPALAGRLWWAPPRNYAVNKLSEENLDAQPSAARPADRFRLTQNR